MEGLLLKGPTTSSFKCSTRINCHPLPWPVIQSKAQPELKLKPELNKRALQNVFTLPKIFIYKLLLWHCCAKYHWWKWGEWIKQIQNSGSTNLFWLRINPRRSSDTSLPILPKKNKKKMGGGSRAGCIEPGICFRARAQAQLKSWFMSDLTSFRAQAELRLDIILAFEPKPSLAKTLNFSPSRD